MSADNLTNILKLREQIIYRTDLLRAEASAALHDLPNEDDGEAFYHVSRVLNYCGSADNLAKDIDESIIEIESALNQGG